MIQSHYLHGRMKSAHGHHGAGIQAPGDAAGARRVRQPVQGRSAPVFDPIRPVPPAQGAGEPLWRGAGREKRPAAALYGHRPATAGLARMVLPLVAEAGRDIARLAQGHAGPLAHRGAMPQLLRLADAGHGCLSLAVARGRTRHHLGISSSTRCRCSSAARRSWRSSTTSRSRNPDVAFSPLFRYESVALMSPRHRLAAKPWLEAADFAD